MVSSLHCSLGPSSSHPAVLWQVVWWPPRRNSLLRCAGTLPANYGSKDAFPLLEDL